MATEMFRTTISFDDDTIVRVNDYMVQRGFKNRSQAVLELCRIALDDMKESGEMPVKKPPVLWKRADSENKHINMYSNLDPLGKEIVNAVIEVVGKYSGTDKYDDPDIAAQKFKEDFILEKKAQEESDHSGATSTA